MSVGPLRFGASRDEVEAVIGSEPRTQICRDYRWWIQAEFRSGVTVYYRDGRLGIVAVHARSGPQVIYNDQALVGRVPSELEQWAVDQHLANGHQLRYSTYADPELYELGLIIRVQRAGDFMLTRPVMLAEPADVSWEAVPTEEWDQWW